jgi:hypothetical protein
MSRGDAVVAVERKSSCGAELLTTRPPAKPISDAICILSLSDHFPARNFNDCLFAENDEEIGKATQFGVTNE